MRRFRIFSFIVALVFLFSVFTFVGCTESEEPYILSIEKSEIESDDNTVVYLIYYSDGTTSSFKVENGKDGKNGENGENGSDVKIEDVFDKYNEYLVGKGEDPISYGEFLDIYLSFDTDYSEIIQSSVLSSVKIYVECLETNTYQQHFNVYNKVERARYSGSGVIYSMDKSENGYSYIITNYHVVFDRYIAGSNKICDKIYGYLYGSESNAIPNIVNGDYEQDEYGYVYNPGDQAIYFEYVGGSIDYDLAVIRTKTKNITDINENAKPVEFADGYNIGEVALAIGNAQGLGISATEGIISVYSENIALSDIDGTKRSYRCLRIDTPIYGGNSGGGLFNKEGKLIGITNAGSNSADSINYAIPCDLVKAVVKNIMFNYDPADIDPSTSKPKTSTVKAIKIGITIESLNSKYEYDATELSGAIIEDAKINSVEEDSLASDVFNLQAGDIIKKVYVGREVGSVINYTEYEITRNFVVTNAILSIRSGDYIKLVVDRDGEEIETTAYHVLDSDIK